jgi:nitrile hydratase accessory protein
MNESVAHVLAAIATIPRLGAEPVFREPWEAQAFATAVLLHGQGAFSWQEWAACLAAKIKRAQELGDPDAGDTYYHHWLEALEHLVVAKGLTTEDALQARRAAWDRAAKATPHGQPIHLSNGSVSGAIFQDAAQKAKTEYEDP